MKNGKKQIERIGKGSLANVQKREVVQDNYLRDEDFTIYPRNCHSDVMSNALKKKKHRPTLKSVQRRTVLRVCSAYHMVSGEAALVIAGLSPKSMATTEHRMHNQQLLKGVIISDKNGKKVRRVADPDSDEAQLLPSVPCKGKK